MEPEAQEAPVAPPPTGDELLAELRHKTPESPRATRPILPTTLDITLEEATTLYAALHKKIARPPKPKPGSGKEELPPQLFCQWLELLENWVRQMPETHPFGRKKPRRVALETLPWEAGYLKRMVNNKKRDEARKDADYYALTEGEQRRSEIAAKRGKRLRAGVIGSAKPTEAEQRLSEIAARRGKRLRAGVIGPAKPTEAEVELAREELMDTLDTCPRGLELAIYLNITDGNVSRVSRLFSQPQRTVAHAVARLRKHLLAKGYSA